MTPLEQNSPRRDYSHLDNLDIRGAWRGDSSEPPSPGPMRTFAIEPGHPLVPDWEPLREEIETALDQSPVRWYALGVYRRRRTLEPDLTQDDTTVLVTAQQDNEVAWQALKERICDICRAHNQLTLRVELVDGSVNRFGPVGDIECHVKPPMGSSLALGGLCWSSGTLGGYVRLSPTEGPSFVCAITCHHVLRPTKPAGLKGPDTMAPCGYDPALDAEKTYHPAVTTPDTKLIVEQPSAARHQAAIKTLEDQVATYQKTVVEYEERSSMGVLSGSGELGLKKARDALISTKALLSTLRNFDRRFGHVWVTSGYDVAVRGCALDWGLVRIDEPRAGTNEVPPLPRPVPLSLQVQLADSVIEKVGSMALGDRVVLLGMKTGGTAGVFSAIKPRVALPGQGQVTTEFVVTALDGRTFAEPGDSGGLVLSEEKAVVGLLLAGPTGGSQGMGYVTPIEDVFQDIERRTGCKIEL